MKVLLLLLFGVLLLHNAHGAMSEAQMKAALKLIRNVCQPKSKVTNEEIDSMHNGNWDLGKPAQCYMWCILNMYHLMTKDNTFDWENGIVTLNQQAPESIRDAAIESVKNCKDAIKTPTDKCVAAFEVGKCIYFDNPGNYFLP